MVDEGAGSYMNMKRMAHDRVSQRKKGVDQNDFRIDNCELMNEFQGIF